MEVWQEMVVAVILLMVVGHYFYKLETGEA